MRTTGRDYSCQVHGQDWLFYLTDELTKLVQNTPMYTFTRQILEDRFDGVMRFLNSDLSLTEHFILDAVAQKIDFYWGYNECACCDEIDEWIERTSEKLVRTKKAAKHRLLRVLCVPSHHTIEEIRNLVEQKLYEELNQWACEHDDYPELSDYDWNRFQTLVQLANRQKWKNRAHTCQPDGLGHEHTAHYCHDCGSNWCYSCSPNPTDISSKSGGSRERYICPDCDSPNTTTSYYSC